MFKLLKVILLVLILVIVYVVVTEISSSKYIYPEYHIELYKIEVVDSKSILIQDKISLIPVKYNGTLDFDTISEADRKIVFINYMLPAIVIERDRLMDMVHHIEFIENGMINKRPLKISDLTFFKEMMQKYDASSIKDLKMRLLPHPVSLVLAQASLESGWGTSKVFSRANNPFGIIAPPGDEKGRKFKNLISQTELYVKTYSSVNQSVEHYFFFIAKMTSYEKFRKKRWGRGSSSDLVKLLKSYHETNE